MPSAFKCPEAVVTYTLVLHHALSKLGIKMTDFTEGNGTKRNNQTINATLFLSRPSNFDSMPCSVFIQIPQLPNHLIQQLLFLLSIGHKVSSVTSFRFCHKRDARHTKELNKY